jgi:hypothetical protein
VKVRKTTTKRSQTLGSHGVTLVSHGGRTDLVLLERLLNLLPGSKMSDIGRDTLASSTEVADGAANLEINLTGVGLSGNGVAASESSLLSDELVKLLNLVVVTIEDLEEGCLSTSGTLDTAEAELITSSLHGSEIHQQILEPDTCSLSNGSELGGLKVSETKAGLVLPLHGKSGELVNGSGHLLGEHVKTVTHQDEISVVCNVA